MFDSTPYMLLIIIAIMMGLAPFYPAPHLYEKIVMLVNGESLNVMDTFDLLFHGAPAVFLVAKILNDYVLKNN